jgi:hypothetical protein
MLIAGMLGFGLAIRHRMIAPPELDLRIGGFRILAAVTDPAHAAAAAQSPHCHQEFYLVWVLAETGAIDRGRQTSIRVLTLPLQCG